MSSKVFDQDQRVSGRDIETMMYFKNILKETECIYLTLLILSVEQHLGSAEVSVSDVHLKTIYHACT